MVSFHSRFYLNVFLCVHLLVDKGNRALWHRFRHSRSGLRRRLGGAPLRVLAPTTCGPADWQDLFTGGERDGERGNRRESQRRAEREYKFLHLARLFFTRKTFLPSFTSSRPFPRAERGHSLCVRARVFPPSSLQLYRRHWNLVCFGLA